MCQSGEPRSSPWHGHERQRGPVSTTCPVPASHVGAPLGRHCCGGSGTSSVPTGAQGYAVPEAHCQPSGAGNRLPGALPAPRPSRGCHADGCRAPGAPGPSARQRAHQTGGSSLSSAGPAGAPSGCCGRGWRGRGEKELLFRSTPLLTPLSHAFILEHLLPDNPPWAALAKSRCHLPPPR